MSSSESFYWHDYETSGADVSRDRPVQFAGLRTDLDFNVLGEPLVIYSKPTPDYLPHPVAVRITGISPYTALEQGVAENAFFKQIHRELSTPGTCGIGYNSLGFDDEITRYGLYRNFYDPYARERDAGRSRWDLIDVTRAFYALRPEGIEWPKRDDGWVSFKLEELSAANGIAHGNAHDALSDVEATIGLARALKARNSALFEALYATRLKQQVATLLDVTAMKPVLYVAGVLGAHRANLAVVVPLAVSASQNNDIICADLSRAPDFLSQDPEVLRERLFAPRESLAEGELRPPLLTIRINKAPVILPMQWLTPERAEQLGHHGDTLRGHLAAIREAAQHDIKGFREHVQAVFTPTAFAPRTDVDAMLYEGFVPPKDKPQCARVIEASADDLREQSWVFTDKRLPELLFRYRARNYPQSLSELETRQWLEHCRANFAPDGPFPLTDFEAALAEERARGDLSPQQDSALNDLGQYAQELQQRLSA